MNQQQHDELSETGITKLARAYHEGTQRIVSHFESFMRPVTERDPRITVDFCAGDFVAVFP